MLSPCCDAAILRDAWGHTLCSRCWALVIHTPPQPQKRDLLGWLFPAEPGPRPSGEPVFVRYGKTLTRTAQARGKPDGWFWCDA